MKIIHLNKNDEYWNRLIDFAENCSWIAGKHLAKLMRNNYFSDWEAVFAAVEADNILGFCTFLKEDYYPENRYSPWISSIFVDEKSRGKRISHKMIETSIQYARDNNFSKVYIPSDMTGFYEKCGFSPVDTLKNYGGDMDTIFMKEI